MKRWFSRSKAPSALTLTPNPRTHNPYTDLTKQGYAVLLAARLSHFYIQLLKVCSSRFETPSKNGPKMERLKIGKGTPNLRYCQFSLIWGEPRYTVPPPSHDQFKNFASTSFGKIRKCATSSFGKIRKCATSSFGKIRKRATFSIGNFKKWATTSIDSLKTLQVHLNSQSRGPWRILRVSRNFCRGCLCTYPPKESSFYELYEGSLWFECLSFTLSCYNLKVISLKDPSHLLWRTDGRTDGDQKCPLIFFSF